MIDLSVPNVVAHDLAGEELLTLEALAEAASRLDPAAVQHHLGALPTVSPYGHARRLPLSTSEVLRSLDTNGSWVMMRRLAALPEYGAVMRRHVRAFDLSLRAQGQVPVTHDLIAFVAAPGATVPVHYDRDHHLLAQVSGTKSVGAGHFRDPDEQRRQLQRGMYDERLNADALPDESTVHQLAPGDALVLPAFTFHWVVVGDDVSVAMTFAITTETTKRSVALYRDAVREAAAVSDR